MKNDLTVEQLAQEASVAPQLDELRSIRKLQKELAHIFPSQNSLDWEVRKHRREYIDGGAIFEVAGRLLAHPPTFKRIALAIGQRKLAARHRNEGEVFERRTHVTRGLPVIGADWEGGKFAGLTLSDDALFGLVLLPGELEEATWRDAMDWAAKQDGALPSRIDQLVLFKNLKSEFKEAWYWSAERYASDERWAWCQSFYDGSQYYITKANELRARAVRRVAI